MKLSKKQIEELKKSKLDIVYFTKFIKVYHPFLKKNVVLYDFLYEKQKEVLKRLRNNIGNKHSFYMSARQSGKTSLALVAILHFIQFNEGKTVAFISNKEKGAQKLLKQFKQYYNSLPEWMKISKITHNNMSEIFFDDDTSIYAFATSSSGVRSFTLDVLYLDEFAIIKPPLDEEFFIANFPAVEHTKGLIMTSTPKGKNNKFYEIYSTIVNEKPSDWDLITVFYQDVFTEYRDEKWKKNKIKLMGIPLYMQEYELSFDYVKDTWIPRELVEKYSKTITNKIYPPKEEQIFNQPDDNIIYICGVDIAEGIGKHFSTIEIFNYNTHEEVYAFGSNTISVDSFFKKIIEIISKYKNIYITFENNDVGRYLEEKIKTNHKEFIKYFHKEKKDRIGIRATSYTNLLKNNYFRTLLKNNDIIINNFGIIEEIKYYGKINIMRDGSHFDRFTAAALAFFPLALDDDKVLQKILKKRKTTNTNMLKIFNNARKNKKNKQVFFDGMYWTQKEYKWEDLHK